MRDNNDKEILLIERALIQTEELYKILFDILSRHREIYYDNIKKNEEAEKTSKGLQQWISTWGFVLYHSANGEKQ